MSGRWYKRCGADFIHGTMMLTLEEKGAYSLCLDLIYDRGGPIPDDARWLSGVCGVSLRKWAAIRDRLISLGKIAAVDGHISNSRADLELVSSELHARKLAESGAKGGRKRAENAGQANKNNDLAEAPPKLTREDKIREESTPNGVQRAMRDPAPKKRRLPADWEPMPFQAGTQAALVVSRWEPGRMERELAKFRDHHTAAGTKWENWQAAWSKWVNGSEDFERGRNGGSRQSGSNDIGKSAAAFAMLNPSDDRPF